MVKLNHRRETDYRLRKNMPQYKIHPKFKDGGDLVGIFFEDDGKERELLGEGKIDFRLHKAFEAHLNNALTRGIEIGKKEALASVDKKKVNPVCGVEGCKIKDAHQHQK